MGLRSREETVMTKSDRKIAVCSAIVASIAAGLAASPSAESAGTVGRQAEPQRRLDRIAAAHPPTFAPGAGWSYSDTNYFVLGLIVEAATGRSLAGELRRRIFAPLRLRSTSLLAAPGIAGRHAHGYFLRPLEDVTVGSP